MSIRSRVKQFAKSNWDKLGNTKVAQYTKSKWNEASDKFDNTKVGKAIIARKAWKTAENDAKIEKLLNSKKGKFNVGLTGFSNLGSIKKYKRDHKGELSDYQLNKLKLAKKAIKQRRLKTAKVIGFAVPLLKVIHSLMTISKGDPKNNPAYSTAKANLDANSNVEIAKASADKDTYNSLKQKAPMQEYNNTLVKVYSRSKLDSTDKKLDSVIERLDDLARINNDTRKNSLAQLELSQKEFAAKANRSDQLLTSIKKIQATSTKSIETSQNKSSGILKKVAVGGGLLALALGPLRTFIRKYKLFKDEVAKEETEGKQNIIDNITDSVKSVGQFVAQSIGLDRKNRDGNPKDDSVDSNKQTVIDRIIDSIKSVGQLIAQSIGLNRDKQDSTPKDEASESNESNNTESTTSTDVEPQDNSTDTNQEVVDRDSIRKLLESKANAILEGGDLKGQSANLHEQIQSIIDEGNLTKDSAGEAIKEAFKNLNDKEKIAYTQAKFGVTADRMLESEDQKSMLIAQLSVLDELKKMNSMQAEQLAIAKDEASESDDSANEDAKDKKIDKLTADEFAKILKESQVKATKEALGEESEIEKMEDAIENTDAKKPKKSKKGKGLFGKLAEVFKSGWKGVAWRLGKLFLGIQIIQGLVGGISGLWERFKDWFGDTPFGQKVIEIGESVGASIGKLWEDIKVGLSKTEFGRKLLEGIDKVKSFLSNINKVIKKVSNFLQGRWGAGNDKSKAFAAKNGMGGLKGDYTKGELKKIQKAAGDDGKLSESDFKNLSKELQARIKNQGDYDYLTSTDTNLKQGGHAYIIGDKKHRLTLGGKHIGNSTIAEISDIINRGDTNLVTKLGTGELQLTEEGFNQLSSKAKVNLAKKVIKDSDEEGYIPAVPYDTLKKWADSDDAGAEFKSALEKRQRKTRNWVTIGSAVAGGIAAGAAAGSVVPVFGTAVGAVAGGLGALLAGVAGYHGTKLFQGSGDKRADKLEAQLKELPQDAEGTDGHPGGPAIVGDGGEREVVVTPDKKTYITPDTPTLVDLPSGSKVIPEHKLVPHYADGTPNSESSQNLTGVPRYSSLFQYNPVDSPDPYKRFLDSETYKAYKQWEDSKSGSNVGKHFDYDNAVKTLKDNSTKVFESTQTAKRKGFEVGKEKPSNQSYGLCAGHVRRAIEAGGIGMSARPGSAYQYSSFLPKVGFKEIDPDEPKKPGDVLVEGKTDKHPHGHIAMWDGNRWISDFIQSRSDGKVHLDGIHGEFSRFRIPEGDVIKPYVFDSKDQINPIEVDHETDEKSSSGGIFDFRKMGETVGELINSFTKPSSELGGDIDIKSTQSKPVNLEMSKDDLNDDVESTKSKSPTILQPITNNNNQRGGDTINNITVNNNYTVDNALGSELRG